MKQLRTKIVAAFLFGVEHRSNKSKLPLFSYLVDQYQFLCMEVICLEDKAFFSLIDRVISHIKTNHTVTEDKWISGEEAMKKLRITSKTTLQKLRDEGKVRFSQPEKKLILYDTDSINEYLDKNSKSTF